MPLDVLRQRPLATVSAAFAVGVAAAGEPMAVFGLAVIGATCLVAGLRSGQLRSLVLFASAFAALGGGRAWIAMRPAADDVSRFAGPVPVTVEGRVASDVSEGSGAYACRIAASHATLADGRSVRCSGGLACLIRRDPEAPAPEFGDFLVVHGRVETPTGSAAPGAYDFAAYERRHGVFARITVSRPSACHLRRDPPTGLALGERLASGCRRSFGNALRRYLPPLEAGLVSGITLGTRSALPPALADDFGVTGTAHILAASGMNVMILAAALAIVLGWARLRPRAISALTLVGLAIYTVAAGAQPSVVRADVMASLYLAASLFDRDPDAPTALAAAAFLLLAADPGDLFDAGFQLSFVVAGALTAASCFRGRGPLEREGPRLSRRVWRSTLDWLWASVVAQVAAAPLIAQHWNMVPLAGVLANALIAPFIAPIMWLALAAWAVASVVPSLASLLCTVVLAPLAQYVFGVVHAFATVPMSAVSVSSPGWPALLVVYTLALCLPWWRRSRACAPPPVTGP